MGRVYACHTRVGRVSAGPWTARNLSRPTARPGRPAPAARPPAVTAQLTGTPHRLDRGLPAGPGLRSGVGAYRVFGGPWAGFTPVTREWAGFLLAHGPPETCHGPPPGPAAPPPPHGRRLSPPNSRGLPTDWTGDCRRSPASVAGSGRTGFSAAHGPGLRLSHASGPGFCWPMDRQKPVTAHRPARPPRPRRTGGGCHRPTRGDSPPTGPGTAGGPRPP